MGMVPTDEEIRAYADWYRSLTLREKVAEDGVWGGFVLHTKLGNFLLFAVPLGLVIAAEQLGLLG
jgi:hypothetical protein